jgi:hypothetical protein
MQLLGVRLVGVGPFEDVELSFTDEDGEPRRVSVVHGGGGVGKTTLVSAIATTRPGHCIIQQPARLAGPPSEGAAGTRGPYVICQYRMGRDDARRPHPLSIASPNARAFADDEHEALRRREQALYDKLARDGGFVFVAISSTRWFSRQPIAISAPARTVARYDVRAPAPLDDASRSDLARDTKQALAYSTIASALSSRQPDSARFERLGAAMRDTVDALVSLAGFSYLGLDAASLEPVFHAGRQGMLSFDALPTRVRHLVAFAALPVRALWAAYPELDPRVAEGVVAIDEADLLQDRQVESRLVAALSNALPGVQWILTTTSPIIAGSADTRDVLALRRLPERNRVELFIGAEARTH